MKRTVPATNQQQDAADASAQAQVLHHRLNVLHDTVNRAKLAGTLGEQYGGDRNVYEALGYSKQLHYHDYLARWTRQDIAKAVINRPVAATWNGSVGIDEGNAGDEKTPLQEDWDNLFKKLNLRFKFARLDRLTSLGRYGVLLLGLSDVTKPEDFQNPVPTDVGDLDLLYVKPYSEASAKISQWETNPNNERYGLPKYYQIQVNHEGVGASTRLIVHHSRIIHTVMECLEDEVYGEPRLKGIYNRLQDLEKIMGGSAEMFWRGARPGYQANVQEGYQMSSQGEEDLKKQIDEFEHKLRRFLVNEGVDVSALEQQVADPSNHVEIQLQMISAETGYPKSVLIGQERGELASTEDKAQWNDIITSRRNEFAEPVILEAFLAKGIAYGFLRPPQDEINYEYVWEDLYAPSDKEKANVGQTRASALGTYAKQPMAQEILPPDLFAELCLGLSKPQIRKVQARVDEEMEQERREMAEEEEQIEEFPENPDNPEATAPSRGQRDDVSQD